MRFLIQAPNIVRIFIFSVWSFPDIVPSFIFQFQLVSSEWNFQTRDRREVTPTKSDQSYPDQKRFFKWFFLSLRNFPLFCSTIRISPLSVGLEPWRKLNNSNTSQAKWFSCIFLDRGKIYRGICLRNVLQRVAKGSWP